MLRTDAPAPGRARRRSAGNAFRKQFLATLDERDEPAAAGEAETDGPWMVVESARYGQPGFAVLREWEDPAHDAPRAWFRERELALLAAALLPAIGKDGWFQVTAAADGAGFRVDQHGAPMGFLPIHDDRLTEALHLAECLVRSPAALAKLLLATSPVALTLAGRILARGLDDGAAEQP